MKFLPKEYQEKGIKFLVSKPAAGLFWPPGLGKTITVLKAFQILRKKKYVDKMLIVSKRRIIYNVWPKEVIKWGLPFRVSIIHGRANKRDVALRADAEIYLINFENLAWLKTQPKKLREQWDVLVVDESSKIRNSRSQRFRALKKMMDGFKRRYILTGSPAPNGLIGLFGQIYILDAGEALGAFITQFRNRYFYPSGYMGYKYELQEGGKERIYKAIKKLILRFSSRVLDMPEKVDIYYEVQLPDEVQILYDEMEEDFIAEYQDKILTAANAGVATEKLRQIANGGLYYHKDIPVNASVAEKKKRETIHLHDEKTLMLQDIVEELQGSPCLVAYEFNHDLERLRSAFPEVPYIGSGVSDAKADSIIDQWNAGELPLLFGHPDSIAHGLNLQDAGCDVVYYSMTWNLENYEQFYQRVLRQGNKHPEVRVHHIIAEGTVDEIIVKTLEQKDATQQDLLNALEDTMASKKGKEIDISIIPDDGVRMLATAFIESDGKRLPKFDMSDDNADRRARNYVAHITQATDTWKDSTHFNYQKRVTGKAPSKKLQEDSAGYKAKTRELAFKVLKITVKGKVVKVDEAFLIRNVGSTTQEGDDMAGKFGKKKSTGKKAAGKKAVPKKATTKKAAPKKAASKKAAVKNKAVKKAAKKTASGGRSSLEEKQEGLVKLLKKRKSGYSLPEVMEEIGVCRKSAVKMLKAVKAKKNDEGNYVK